VLLEAREAREAEQPLDTRRSLEDFAAEALHEAAQQSGDPDKYLAMHKAHEARRAFHTERLRRQRPPPDDGRGFLDWAETLFADATSLAESDGFPPPGSAPAPEAIPEPSRPRLGDRREGAEPTPPLPAVIQDDVAQSRARDMAPRRREPDEAEDKLAAFRGIGPLDYFSHYPDD
jgi:hypothetical protein